MIQRPLTIYLFFLVFAATDASAVRRRRRRQTSGSNAQGEARQGLLSPNPQILNAQGQLSQQQMGQSALGSQKDLAGQGARQYNQYPGQQGYGGIGSGYQAGVGQCK